MYIAIDFDGTIVKHAYPGIGEPIKSIPWILKFKEAGAKVFLWTMRSDKELKEAVQYCKDNGLEFDGINTNPTQKTWTNSPKCYAHLYIDDAAFGCPLIYPEIGRPYVNWDIVGPEVLKLLNP